ncbi:hypothetical protein DFJ74DRAFT_679698 [Hyaloraphidium curvatum]|nr:hypothetical protein DFJ74DRAFT_679698 [Hyaloraphidium curvatum]
MATQSNGALAPGASEAGVKLADDQNPPPQSSEDAASALVARMAKHRSVVPQTAHLEDFDKPRLVQWLYYNFPRPTRLQIARVFRALVVGWCAFAIAVVHPTVVNITVVGGIISFDTASGQVVAVLVNHFVLILALAIGVCFNLLGQLWLSLYNQAHLTDANPYMRALISEIWIVFVVWGASAFQYRFLGTPLAVFGLLCVPVMFAFVGAAPLEVTERIPFVAALFETMLLPLALIAALGCGAAIVLPEHDTEATRSGCLDVLGDLRFLFAGEATTEDAADFYSGRLRTSLAALVTSTKGCMIDIGFLRDAPARMVRVSRVVQDLARFVNVRVRSAHVARALDVAMAALQVETPVWSTSRYIYGDRRAAETFAKCPAPQDFVEVGEELEKRRAELCAQSLTEPHPEGSFFDEHDSDALLEYLALGGCQKLLEELKSLVEARRGLRFFAFGNPDKHVLGKKPPKAKRATKAQSDSKKRGFHCGRIFSDVLYTTNTVLASDATKFGFKRALAFFLASVWAFLPGTMDAYYERNILWVVITVFVLMQPTLGSGITKSVARLGGTGFGVLWSYLAFLAAGGGSLEWNVKVAVLMFIPVSIVGYYVQVTTTKHVYAGQLLMLTYMMVFCGGLYSGSGTVQTATAALQRALWISVGAVGCLAVQILIFPFLARTDVRKSHAAVLSAIEDAVRQAEFGSRLSGEDQARNNLVAMLETAQQKLTMARAGALLDSLDEPDLDRPWDSALMRAISATVQKLLALAELIVSRAHGVQVLAAPAEQMILKLHTVAKALQDKQPLPRLPRLHELRFPRAIVQDARSASARLVASGVLAAVGQAMFEVDVLEELVGRLYGRKSLPGEDDREHDEWYAWIPVGKTGGALNPESERLLQVV